MLMGQQSAAPLPDGLLTSTTSFSLRDFDLAWFRGWISNVWRPFRRLGVVGRHDGRPMKGHCESDRQMKCRADLQIRRVGIESAFRTD
jgi:hypothetical protein